MKNEFNAVATCGFGLESVLSFELKKLGLGDMRASDGRVAFRADSLGIARANLWLRTAERVMIVLGEYKASTFDELFDGARAIPFGDYIGRRDAFPVKGYCMNSKLTSVPACQSVLKKAAVERLKSDHGTQFLTEKSGTTVMIRFSIVKDVCTVMLDTSGDGLHKRGYRPLLNEAPIKETIAAGICDLARVFPESRVRDPFCGSGTLVIEAALRAKNIAPGMNRTFAAEGCGFIGKAAFDRAREEARGLVRADAPFFGIGSDIDLAAVDVARANAERAGVDDCVSFSVADARHIAFGDGELVLANPPYGERLMSEDEALMLYREFYDNYKRFDAKGLYIISSSQELERSFGKKATRRRKLYNGMLPCQLYMYF